MLASCLGILECLVSISRYVLGLWIVDGFLRDMGAMKPRWLRDRFFHLSRHKRIVLVLVVHDAL